MRCILDLLTKQGSTLAPKNVLIIVGVDRPNLHYRFYHIRSPLSRHVTMVSVSGLDEEGWVFSVGSACRHSRRESWKKSLLEAVQGRHCVRRQNRKF